MLPPSGTKTTFASSGRGTTRPSGSSPRWSARRYARAVVGAAVAAFRAARHTLTFVIAHEDDWPRELYAKLGFELVGTTSRFRRS